MVSLKKKGVLIELNIFVLKVKKVNIKGKTSYVISCENPCTSSNVVVLKILNYKFNSSMPRDDI